MSSINNNITSVNKIEKILHSNLMNLKNCTIFQTLSR